MRNDEFILMLTKRTENRKRKKEKEGGRKEGRKKTDNVFYN